MMLSYYGAMGQHFQQMAAELAKGELSLDDFERRAKSVRSIQGGMDSVEKVAAAGTHADQQPMLQLPAPDDTAETERLSREIMERFERIQQRRAAEGAAD
jgi:hypothetical protein